MKIIKYVFLLVILAIIGLSVFVATQKNTFSTSKSIFIKVNKSVVFTYLNDYKNWEEWTTLKEDQAEIEFTYPDITSGLGAFYTKNGKKGPETTTTTFVKQNDSIAQKVTLEGINYNSSLKFKDSIGGTLLTWTAAGTVDFSTKIQATFSGGLDQLMGINFEKSLYNLNKILNKEINIYDISIQGIIQKKGGFYLKQSTTCTKQDFQNKLQIMLPRMVYFFKNNDLKMNGKPFVIYENKDNDSLKFSICGPLFEEIFLSENSDIQIGFLEPFYALKTTLIGDYSHLPEAKKKATQYLNSNKIIYDNTKNDLDIYTVNGTDVKNHSKWKTDLLLPIVYKIAIPKVINESIPAAMAPDKAEIIAN